MDVRKGQAPPTSFSVSPEYFRVLGVRMVRGREFSEHDLETAPPVTVINQWAAAHWWPGQDPVGRTIRVDTAPERPA